MPDKCKQCINKEYNQVLLNNWALLMTAYIGLEQSKSKWSKALCWFCVLAFQGKKVSAVLLSPSSFNLLPWYPHHTRQSHDWPNLPQKDHIRNAFYMPEYLCGFVLLLCAFTALVPFALVNHSKIFCEFHMCWNKIICPVQQCLLVKASVLFGGI